MSDTIRLYWGLFSIDLSFVLDIGAGFSVILQALIRAAES